MDKKEGEIPKEVPGAFDFVFDGAESRLGHDGKNHFVYDGETRSDEGF